MSPEPRFQNPSAAKKGSLEKSIDSLRHLDLRSDGMAAMWEQNPFASLLPNQSIAIIPSFTLECGERLYNAPVAYTTHGRLSKAGDNAVVVCHALSGSADVTEWWKPLLGGPDCPLDISLYYVVCLNSLGSPYGSASPMTYVDGEEGKGRYGPEFPPTTIRDDVNIHQLVLADLGVRQIAAVIGGSMGGMLALEYAFLGESYVRSIVAVATSAEHSAWCIGWGEMQRQSIYGDPKFRNGYYDLDDPPVSGLATARIAAMLMYRSRNSIHNKFSRNTISSSGNPHALAGSRRMTGSDATILTSTPDCHACKTRTGIRLQPQEKSIPQLPTQHRLTEWSRSDFAVKSYLDYQGTKFVRRFDSNCYVATTKKLDTHDISRGRVIDTDPRPPMEQALAKIQQPVLVIGIESDLLFPDTEQVRLAEGIPNARFRTIASPEGHDAFLLSTKQVSQHILDFMHSALPKHLAPKGDQRA